MIELEKYDRLSSKEINAIKKILDGHGKIKVGSNLTGLNRITIKRAKEGLPITKESANIIREKLLQ